MEGEPGSYPMIGKDLENDIPPADTGCMISPCPQMIVLLEVWFTPTGRTRDSVNLLIGIAQSCERGIRCLQSG